ncbi:MAG: AMP-binding protein [Actinomycetia bacterium]|nr:AMP-binding protein [Actinomycetes bacterium]MCP4958254.1 AMP-binding protein [Actinomycetes bacterium]
MSEKPTSLLHGLASRLAGSVGDVAGLVSAGHRLGAFDPFYNGARALGVIRWGPNLSAMVAASATRFGSRVAIDDCFGQIDYSTFDSSAANIAAHLRNDSRDGAVGILCRNHRWFLMTQVAVERAGRDVVMLSTALPPSGLAEVVKRERVGVLVADSEFESVIVEADLGEVEVLRADGVVGAAAIGDGLDSWTSLANIAATRRFCPPPRRRGRLVMLTSGTTGPPKGARRDNRPAGVESLTMFADISFRACGRVLIAPPLFHAWGLSQASLAIATSSTVFLRPRFDPAETADLMSRNKIDSLVVVPLMLRRLLRTANIDSIHPPGLVLSSGNVLSGDLALEWMDRFGDHLYNFYGSTEAALGTIAAPDDLRKAPGTVGRAPRGVTIGIFDEDGGPVPSGERGRVHLGSSLRFSGYTDGSDAESRNGLMATGDLGYLDPDGLLHVEGRVNDMIVTGGENVFPCRVEEAFERQPGIDAVAVVGVPDDDYGQRVVAFVVSAFGHTVDVDALLAEVRSELQAFMVPREIRIVETLPMTTTGKVIRHRLAVLGDPDRV